MQSSFVSLAIAAVVGGAVGGLAVGLVMRTSEPEPSRSSQRIREEPSVTADDDEQLESRVQRLEAQLGEMQRRSAAASALADYAKVLAANQEPSADAGRGLNPVIDGEDPVFELAVRSVVDKLETERHNARRAEREQRQVEQAQRQADFFAERLRLNSSERARMEQIIVDQMRAFQNLWRGDADAGQERPRSRDEWRERVNAIRQDTEQKLSGVLSSEQMEEYKKLVAQEGFGGPGPGPGPGGGRPRGGRSE